MNTAEHIVNLFEKSIELKRKSIVLAPVIAVITTIEEEHLDVYRSGGGPAHRKSRSW